MNRERALSLARRVLRIEADAIGALEPRIGEAFTRACAICRDCRGRIVVTGMGKSGHIASKVAATLASTGSPAFFLHPGEASHGDIGMITRHDVVLAVSNSGETEEIITILPLVKRLGAPLIAMTGNVSSTLACEADVNLDISVREEACPLNLAPTASTTATLAMGDALAVTLLDLRGFTEQDFALSHPGGALGRRLLLHVRDVMHTGERIPKVSPTTTLSEGLVEMSRKGLGLTAIADAEGMAIGIFTDGDLRRALDRGLDVHSTPMSEVMTSPCKTIGAGVLAAEAVHLMETHEITGLLVVDEADTLIGALNIHDLFRARVV